MAKIIRIEKSFLFTFLIMALSCATREDHIKPILTPIVESVYSSVIVQPDSLYQVHSSVSGIVENVFVEEGDLISKGEPLMQLTDVKSRLNTQNSKLALDLKQESYSGSATLLEELENEIVIADLRHQNDSVYFVKQRQLWEQKIGTQKEYDNRKLNYEIAARQLHLLKKRYERTKNELETQLKQAENNYLSSQTQSEDYTVESKIDGRVYSIRKSAGEMVSMQESVAAIGSKDRFIIEMQVDEVDIVRVREGQNVLVVLDAYEDDIFISRVTKITPSMANQSQTFLVEGEFEMQPEVLYSGFTGEANIIISEKASALSIPVEYLMEDDWVMTTDGKVKVETGVRNLEFVEIIAGLDTTSVLLKKSDQ